MPIVYHSASREFHLYNNSVSYIIRILKNGQPGMLYYGTALRDREAFSAPAPAGWRPLAACAPEGSSVCLQYTPHEYPAYGAGDFHEPAVSVLQENGSRISDFRYVSHTVFPGKRPLEGLPATYTEADDEADTLELTLRDPVDGAEAVLSYTVFASLPVVARSVRFVNRGSRTLVLERAMSASVDLPDSDFEMLHLSGAWSRERQVKRRRLGSGLQSIGSLCGSSSAEQNPFFALARPNADEKQGEVYAFSLVYSGNFLAQAEVDSDGMTRAMLGIHPGTFRWALKPGESFQTPEAVLVYSRAGLNGMSQTFHTLYGRRLARGVWRDRERPVLINNWEATGFRFDEAKLLRLAKLARRAGIELFVLDDGWFGARENDSAGLGDWMVNRGKLPDGIDGLAEKINALGMRFGLWIEPEMVNPDSDLFRAHPDWILQTPGRAPSLARHQCVLDFSRGEVVEAIHGMLYRLLSGAKISYIKWDMNRYLTECFSQAAGPQEQGMVFHRYILGVYRLYERLTSEFPEVLFESCSSGGARFDPGMLYYAPQGWTSDDTDAAERLNIQYGTSFVYPPSSMGAHVSMVPNQQVGRVTPMETRARVAMFGAFGYELDLESLSGGELDQVARQVAYVKAHRRLLQYGTFWRLKSPFADSDGAWMTVSHTKAEAIAVYFRMLRRANAGPQRLKLAGLDPARSYTVNGDGERVYGGDELMEAGLVLLPEDFCSNGDFSSALFELAASEK